MLILGGNGDSAVAQTDQQRVENLRTCLSGKYPSLCKLGWLSPDQAQRAAAAQKRENLSTCLTGRYPSLCKKGLLSNDEAAGVDAAERRENLSTCLTGRYRALCKKGLLSKNELARVEDAERRENAAVCVTGRFPSLCNKALLTKEQAAQTALAEQQVRQRSPKTVAANPRQSAPTGYRRSASACDDGHWIESVSDDGRIVTLEDGSIWEIDAVDRIDTMLWLPVTDIIVCGDRLINADDNEAVGARQLR